MENKLITKTLHKQQTTLYDSPLKSPPTPSLNDHHLHHSLSHPSLDYEYRANLDSSVKRATANHPTNNGCVPDPNQAVHECPSISECPSQFWSAYWEKLHQRTFI